ncbi:MAG TPA: acyl-CoA dehydrogenase family protein [Candidatus Thermoplasmatota archaeon]|nr:acyl-CoA dehydrogenase family protein [Candidatus Thermoplasmatota archaeon]
MAIAFQLSEQEELWRRSVRGFLQDEIAPRLPELRAFEDKHAFPWPLVRRLAAQGLMGVPIPRAYGGAGLGEVGYCILMEELVRVDTSLATIVGAHTGIAAQPLYLFGTEEQRRKHLPRLASGEQVGAFCLTEPQAGSDAANLKCVAARERGGWRLRGTKLYVTNGDAADVLIVMALTDPALGARGGVTAFIVEKGFGGYHVGTIEDKMGIRGSTTAELVFEDCLVPDASVLGEVGLGFVVALTALDGGRVGLAAGTLGGAQGALDMMVRAAQARQRLGEDVGSLQQLQAAIADTAMDVHLARYAVYHAARAVGEYYDLVARKERVPRELREGVSREAGIVKAFVSEAASRAIDRAVQSLGPYGGLEAWQAEKHARDSVIAEIFEGTNEIQRFIIARDLLGLGGFYA